MAQLSHQLLTVHTEFLSTLCRIKPPAVEPGGFFFACPYRARLIRPGVLYWHAEKAWLMDKL